MLCTLSLIACITSQDALIARIHTDPGIHEPAVERLCINLRVSDAQRPIIEQFLSDYQDNWQKLLDEQLQLLNASLLEALDRHVPGLRDDDALPDDVAEREQILQWRASMERGRDRVYMFVPEYDREKRLLSWERHDRVAAAGAALVEAFIENTRTVLADVQLESEAVWHRFRIDCWDAMPPVEGRFGGPDFPARSDVLGWVAEHIEQLCPNQVTAVKRDVIAPFLEGYAALIARTQRYDRGWRTKAVFEMKYGEQSIADEYIKRHGLASRQIIEARLELGRSLQAHVQDSLEACGVTEAQLAELMDGFHAVVFPRLYVKDSVEHMHEVLASGAFGDGPPRLTAWFEEYLRMRHEVRARCTQAWLMEDTTSPWGKTEETRGFLERRVAMRIDEERMALADAFHDKIRSVLPDDAAQRYTQMVTEHRESTATQWSRVIVP